MFHKLRTLHTHTLPTTDDCSTHTHSQTHTLATGSLFFNISPDLRSIQGMACSMMGSWGISPEVSGRAYISGPVCAIVCVYMRVCVCIHITHVWQNNTQRVRSKLDCHLSWEGARSIVRLQESTDTHIHTGVKRNRCFLFWHDKKHSRGIWSGSGLGLKPCKHSRGLQQLWLAVGCGTRVGLAE